MSTASPLPQTAAALLDRFVADARTAFGDDLLSIVLFGSAAEGALRASSDLNLIVVLRRFERAAAARLTDSYRFVHAAGRLAVMVLLEGEIAAASEAFAVKFLDIAGRHRVLHGNDPFAGLAVPRDAVARRLRQVLLNLELRLREQFLAAADQPERLAHALAESAGPLRAAAAAMLWLEGRTAATPKAALTTLARDLDGAPWDDLLAAITAARGGQPVDDADAMIARLLALADALRRRSLRV